MEGIQCKTSNKIRKKDTIIKSKIKASNTCPRNILW